MKLATLNDDSRDGELVVVSRDLQWAASANQIARNLQEALEHWDEVSRPLTDLSLTLDSGKATRVPFDATVARAPLPRAWQWLDGSAFKSHGDLMSTIFKTEKLAYDVPLMYQGMSHSFLSGHDDVPFMSEADGIDFEGEFGVIIDFVPMGTCAAAAASHIKLIVLINDWSLRFIAPIEMKTGFGWVQAKPACSMAPIAITPGELGSAWLNDRVSLPLEVAWNQKPFGAPNGAEMAFSFSELIAHAARTRDLCAGTIIGSGTVSNANYRSVGSTCIAEHRGIEVLDHGTARTGFMKFGDEVLMQARLDSGASIFGQIRQTVVQVRQ